MIVNREPQAKFVVREMCLGDALDDAADHWPDRVGWVFDDVRVTFRQMRERTDQVARSLLALGVGRNDKVALWTPNLAEFAYCQFACAKIGAVILAINTRFKSFELEHILLHSDAKVLILVEQFLKHDFIGTLRGLCPDWTQVSDGTICSQGFPELRRIVSLSTPASAGTLPWTDFLALSERIDASTLAKLQSAQDWSDPILLQYTSGTTALPKGALCNHRYALNFGVEYALRTGLKPGEPFLNTQPFYHVGGSCGAVPLPLSTGGSVVSAAYYEVERILGLIERERCTSRSGYGAMYIMEMNHPRFRDFDLSSLRGAWCVGTPALMERIRDTFNIPNLVQIYASTEGGGTGGSYDEPWELRSNTCGRAVTGTEVGIFDPDSNKRLPAGTIGEIRLNGWWQMNGYLKQPAETAKTIDTEGWVHTGDLGSLDADGYLRFAGRLKDMLKIGGENVSAEEVETVLLQHPDIKQVAVIGAPDERLTEVVMAIIETKVGATLDEKAVIAFCTGRVANFRVPRHVRFVSEWPMTGSGKIQKHLLREQFLTDFPRREVA